MLNFIRITLKFIKIIRIVSKKKQIDENLIKKMFKLNNLSGLIMFTSIILIGF